MNILYFHRYNISNRHFILGKAKKRIYVAKKEKVVANTRKFYYFGRSQRYSKFYFERT